MNEQDPDEQLKLLQKIYKQNKHRNMENLITNIVMICAAIALICVIIVAVVSVAFFITAWIKNPEFIFFSKILANIILLII